MESFDFVLLLSRSLHILAAMTAIGGAIFQRVALQPAGAEPPANAADIRARWSKVVFASIGVLFLTGFVNFAILAWPSKIQSMPYHPMFGVKLLAALYVFFLASALAGRAEGLAKFREASRKWLGVIIVLGMIIVLISGALSQISRVPAELAREPEVNQSTE
ncbi:MAG: hypothetical protein ACYTHJ_14470 [Planctomycetota bacterium]|jgi:uncharacterized membrane protein